ncbi:PGF-pre-PGF domain-containing protein [Methanolobus sp. ZRKC5]|uniref:PGF-pre-PGF domain-containing protein n=1 Tax=unclassified Methanolobus TaxID=2629569 RepID=UPI00313AD602
MIVSATNSTPVLEVIGDRTVDEGSLLSFTLSASDSNNDSLVFSSSGLPNGSNLNGTTGLFEWLPSYEQSGIYLIQFVVSDGGNIDSEYITITVNNVNRLPLFSPISDTAISEKAQATLILEASDSDSDILVFSKDVSFGNLQGNVFTWMPGYDDQGEHTIIFTANDGFSSVTQTSRINVSNVNREPVLYSIGDTSVPQNAPVTIQLNGYDPDGDTLNYSIVGILPEGASLDANTGLFQWPNAETLGFSFLQFSVDDGFASKTRTAKIIVGDSNSPPVINTIDPQLIDENSELSFEISASDPDADKLSFSYPDNLPPGSILTITKSSVQFTWTPSYEQAGNYKIEFGVSDSSTYGYSAYEVVDIVVLDVNQAPVIDLVNDYTLSEKNVLNIDLSANDPDNDDFTFSTNSSFGTVRGNMFTWTPGYSDAGVHDIWFTVSDGSLSNSTKSTIIVNDANMPPKINYVSPLEVSENETLTFSLSVYDEDLNDTFTYAAIDSPSGANFNSSTATFEWTPSSTQLGKYSVGFYVNDGALDDYETISITVVEPSLPVIPTSSSSGGGGSGGGGSMNTGERYENIDLKDYTIKYVMKDKKAIFEFDEPANSIMSIGFVSRLNGGQTKAVVEMLRGTSALVDAAPDGEVYKNLNIWVGDSKFSSDVIYDVAIKFKVEKSWIVSNDLDFEFITLYRYSDGMWNSLETSFIAEDGGYFYYETKSPGFSPFAIVIPHASELIITENSSFINETKMSISDEIILDEGKDSPQDKKRPLVFLLILGLIVAVAVVGTKYRSQYEKLYTQIGNPDGKRYRRLKK